MFTFEDLQQARRRRRSRRCCAPSRRTKLPIALKGASEALRDLFFANMSERAGKLLQGRDGGHGPGAPASDVDEAQRPWSSVGQGPRGAAARSSSPTARAKTSWSTEPGHGTAAEIHASTSPSTRLGDAGARRSPAEPPLHRATSSTRRARRPRRRPCRRRSPRPAEHRRSALAADALAQIAEQPRRACSQAPRTRRARAASAAPSAAGAAIIAQAVARPCRRDAARRGRGLSRPMPARARSTSRASWCASPTRCSSRCASASTRSPTPPAIAGRIVLRRRRASPARDCRVEWADGGAERDLAGHAREIDGLARAPPPIQPRPRSTPLPR